MRQRITNGVVQQMLPYLNNAQIEKLKDVLEHILWNYDIAPADGKKQEQEQDYLSLFLQAKRVEGCSEKSVPSSIMRKFIYNSGRTQSAQGRKPALDYPIAEGREARQGRRSRLRSP